MRYISLGLRLILLGVFLLVTLLVVAEARGWRLNRRQLRLERTGTLVVRFQPEDAVLAVNNRAVNKKSPIVLSHLIPGRYDATLRKPDYQTWTSNFVVEAERVVAEIDVVLFRTEPIVELVSDEAESRRYLQQSRLPIDPDSDPTVKDQNEIWLGENLVTRVAEPVHSARWLIERDYIIFQTGQEFRVVRADGTNDVVVARLTTREISSPLPNRRGSEFLFRDGERLKRAVIR